MTIYLADIASYQRGLTPSALLAAGFTAVNVKTSHGLGAKSVATDAARWLADTRFTHSTFHWLTADASGAAQAEHAFRRLVELKAARPGVLHVVDVEEPAVTGTTYSEYVTTMTRLLGRPIATYTGDWYWPKAWMGANISPWLHAAPNVGYVGAYPGDSSTRWSAGYGGWQNLAIMQYAVKPVAGIQVSMSAVRDHALWDEMRGVMATSQNGWPVVSQNAVVERTIAGAAITNGWLKGDVDTIFTDLAVWLNAEIEKIHNGWCWGHNVREVRGGSSISNHASGTAFDYNAPNHPLGVRDTFSPAKREKIRSRLRYYEGVIRWGGDYKGRPDDMHFEINDDRAAVKRVAEKVRAANKPKPVPEEDEVKQEDRDDIVNRVVARLKAELPRATWEHELLNPYNNKDMPAGTILRYVPSANPHAITQAKVDAIDKARQAYEQSEDATDQAVVEELAAIRRLLSPEQPAEPVDPATPATPPSA